jgi:tetratricopeptide (TPR) repeat protein
MPEPAWSRLRASNATLVLVHGVAGSGKSRLLAQAWPTASRWACSEAGRGVPLAPVLPMMAPLGDQLRTLVPEPALRRELARLLPALADGERLPPPELGPGDVVDTLARVLPRWVDRLLVDDLHWADPATLQVLQRLCAGGEIRLVATVRTDRLADLPAWARGPGAELIELGPLDGAAASRWLAQLTGRAAPRLAAWLQQTADGIPLLMEQLLQALRDDGPLGSADAPWPDDLDARVDACAAWPLPRQVRSVIQRRFDGLPADLKRVLRALAVWGAPADLAALAALCGSTPPAVADALYRAEAAGWIADGRLAHDLLRESVLQHTPERPLRQMHHAAARLGQSGPASMQDPHRSAEHWWSAGDEAAAVAAELQAARHDRERGLHAAAVRRLHEAELRCTAADGRSALAGLQGWLWLELGDAEQALRHGERALALADSPERQLDLRLLMAHAALERGQLAEAARLHAQAATLQPDDPEVLTLAGHLAMLQGDHPRLAAAVERLGAIVGSWAAGPDRAEALTSQGTALAVLGRVEEAVGLTREALAMARHCQARHVEVGAARNLVALLTDQGRLDEAVNLGRAALALGDYKGTAVLKNNLGRALKRLQRWDEAQALFGELTADRDPSMRCYAWGHLIDIHGRRGATEAVRLAIEAGLAARERTEQGPARDMVLQGVLAHGNRADVERVDRLLAAAGGPPSPLVAAARQDAERRLGG